MCLSLRTIANCFQHTKILPPEWNTCTESSGSSNITNHIAAGEESTAIVQQCESHILEEVTAASVFPGAFNEEPVDIFTTVQSLICALSERLGESDVLTASEYVSTPDEQQIEPLLSDADLLERYQKIDQGSEFQDVVTLHTNENDEDEVVFEEIEPRRPVSLQQAREATQQLLDFAAANQWGDLEAMIMQLSCKLDSMQLVSCNEKLVQKTLENYFA